MVIDMQTTYLEGSTVERDVGRHEALEVILAAAAVATHCMHQDLQQAGAISLGSGKVHYRWATPPGCVGSVQSGNDDTIKQHLPYTQSSLA